MILVVHSRKILEEIGALPAIEGDSTPLLIGEPIVEACEKPRYAISHNFTEAQLDWMMAYTSGENPAGQIYEQLPDDWVYPVLEPMPEPTPEPIVDPVIPIDGGG